MTQAPTPGPLWMMHVIGPDDIYPAPDHATAVEWCAALNASMPASDVLCVAVPAIWTGTPEAHAEGLSETVEGWTSPRQRLAPTAPVEASGSEREHGPKCWGKTSISDEMMYCYCGSTDSPPGETRSRLIEVLKRIDDGVYPSLNDRADAILALLSARPLTLGGQKGNSETLRVLLDNLVIAQTLSKDIRQKATDEARSYLYDLRHTLQPSGETRGLLERATAIADDVERGKRPKLEAVDMIRELRSALLSARPLAFGGQQGEARRVRHKKRGTEYTIIGVGRAQGEISDEDPVVLYRGDADGGLWVRHQAEFSDGRFEYVTTPARAEDQDEGAAGEPWGYAARRVRIDGSACEAPWTPGKINDGLYMLIAGDPDWEIVTLYTHPSPTPAADADRVREVSWGPDASNPNDRRLYVDGSQWAKVYGWDKASLDARCAIIEAALKSTAAKEGEKS